MYLLLRLSLYLVPLLLVAYMYMSTAIPSLTALNLKLWKQFLEVLEVLGGALGGGATELPIGTNDLAPDAPQLAPTPTQPTQASALD